MDSNIANQSDVQTVYEKRCDGTKKLKDEVISVPKVMTIKLEKCRRRHEYCV